MGKIDWRVKRVHYGFALGLLIALAAHFKSPGAVLCGYALFALVTSLRFHTLGWKVNRAFIPLGIAAAGTLVAAMVGPGPTALNIVTQSHAVALLAQIGMSIRAAMSCAPVDPISRKMALGRDLRIKRRQLVEAIKDAKPVREEFAREMALLNSLNAERAAHVAAHGYTPTPESTALAARIAAQLELVQRLGEESRSRTETKTAELNAALDAWRNRNKRDAA